MKTETEKSILKHTKSREMLKICQIKYFFFNIKCSNKKTICYKIYKLFKLTKTLKKYQKSVKKQWKNVKCNTKTISNK